MTDTEALLKRLEDQHRTFCIALGKQSPTLYSEAAAEIRRLLELLKAGSTSR